MTCVTNGQTNEPCPNLTFSLGTNRLTTSAFTYDAAGNLTNDSSTTPAHTYQWDAEERVKSVDSGSTWSFTYNAVGDRVQWSRPGGADQHIFDAAGTSLGVYGGWDVVWMGGRVLTVYEGSETNFFHVNHLNSAAMATNHAGGAVEDILFYPWGQDTWRLWGSGGYSFAGMPYYDTNTNTNPTMFRFYSQNLGRWHSPDPLAGDITNPQSLNRYAYVLNNPTRLTDPLGLGGDDDCTWDPSTSTLTCPKPPPEETSQSNKPDNPSDPYGLAYLPLGRGWGLGGGCGPTPGQQKIRQVVNLALHQQELSDCLNKIFGPGNILNNQNLPILDTRVSQAQINSQSRRLGVQGTYQTPVPTSGRGTVQIPTELFYNPNTTMGFLAATFIHETGNILAIQMFGSSRYAQATNPAIVGLDRDTGAALEECVFGGLVRPNGSTWP